MSPTGFTIAKVVVQGAGKADAVLEFGPGLNVVAGASNTGKTYAWQLIDFMLGASKPPKSVPPGTGYSHSMIEVSPRAGGSLTLQRALAGGGATAYAVPIEAIADETPFETLGEQHSAQNPLTISGRLLAMSNLAGKQIRKNQDGVKRSLSFRDVAWLAFVDEERIIAERSPALSEMPTAHTEKKSAFWLFLTGSDDSAIVTQEAPKDRKRRLAAEMSILADLLNNREARFKTFEVDTSQLVDQQVRLARAVEAATGLVAARQSELDSAAATRDVAWEAIQALRSKHLFVTEQLSRLELLDRHYAADKARLESSLEAGKFFEQLPSGECPVCGHLSADSDESGESDQRLREFQAACTAELDKITMLVRDLGIALSVMRSEKQGYEQEQSKRQATLDQANAAIAGLLNRKVRAANEELSQLLSQQARLAEAAHTANEVMDLRTRYSNAEQLSKAKTPKSKFTPKVGAAGTAEFCRVVEATLRAWKFPVEGNVSWADTEFDLVIGSENRGSMGKGYRAVTHAAFTVALMRYCRQKGLPHPGVVAIDSPLNPFKGADQDSAERVNTEVQEAFYADLAADKSGDQIIVFENTEPPTALRNKIRYTHFSGNPTKPRAGFFPVPI
ncbi:MAG: hypothetical protein IT434_10095 [Phycisphaerales bacterium]|nr:hypothetical protein [Phycisphaerales bacterium]